MNRLLSIEPPWVRGWRVGFFKMRMVVIAFVVSLAAMAGLVFAIRAGREDVASKAGGGTPGSAPAATGDASSSKSEATASKPRLTRFGSFNSPLLVTAPNADRKRVFVVEQGGAIRVVVNGKKIRRPFLSLRGEVSADGERGLLGLAFAPDYASSGKFYVDFTDRQGNTRIQEFQRSNRPNRASKSSRRPLLTIKQPYPNHNGGMLAFGPDKMLYIGMGDGGSGGDPQNRAQNRDSLLGKLLRIDPRPARSRPYSIPDTNPYATRGGRGEIYSMGLRNPWRFTFDRKTGDIYIADVGQDAFEEIDFATRGGARGANFGWSCFEGRSRYNASRSCAGAVAPKLVTSHKAGNCSITGGVVVRNGGPRSLRGRYLYGDFCVGRIYSVKITGNGASHNRPIGVRRVASLSSFGQDARGHVYVTSLDGSVYRIR